MTAHGRDLNRVTEAPNLAAFYTATGGANWNNNAGWNMFNTNNDGYACISPGGGIYTTANWHGIVVCSFTGEAAMVFLNSNNLRGTIPTQIGALTSLQYALRLSSNSISGTLPTQLGLLTSLRSLELQHNSISGTLPTQIGLLGRNVCGRVEYRVDDPLHVAAVV